jgi:hypothetical protein
MIKKVLLNALEQNIIAPEELYNLDDQGLFSLMAAKQKNFPQFSIAENVREGRLYTEIASFFFDNQKHASLLLIKNRQAHESALAQEINRENSLSISADSIIIDVPEPVSFETDLFVKDENCVFTGSSSAFTGNVMEAFVFSLRKIRIYREKSMKISKTILQNYKYTL